MLGKRSRFIIFLMAALFLILPVTAARADLTITPLRVVFEGRTRSATVELLNITNTTNSYRLSWKEMKIDPKTGRFILMPVDENDPHSVGKMVIFTPRQVTIAPHGHQTIRLSLRRPADLPPGEYRAHLVMTRLAKLGPERQEDAKELNMSLKVNLGFSIPIIVRSGDDKGLKISLTSPNLHMSKSKRHPGPELGITIHRDAGHFSSYGTLKVYWQNEQGREQQIGEMNNVALYPETESRTMDIALSQNPTSGMLKVVYEGKYESEGKTWAEKSFPIGH
jgi:P pilus assembly chaperone PapD